MKNIDFVWDEQKRLRNIYLHGLDFKDAPQVFEGYTVLYEDDRFKYEELRFVTLGLLYAIPVQIVHTESEYEIRIISFRKATKLESAFYWSQVPQ